MTGANMGGMTSTPEPPDPEDIAEHQRSERGDDEWLEPPSDLPDDYLGLS